MRTFVKMVNGRGCVDTAIPDDFAAVGEDREGSQQGDFHFPALMILWVS